MKYIVILGDGMADLPVDALDGKTPLEAARHPFADMMAKKGLMGMVKTIPDGMAPGSDAANMSVLGYSPAKYYTGRSPLEAVSMGISLADDDIAIRCNLVTLSGAQDLNENSMTDYCSGEITTSESRELIAALKESLDNEKSTLYAGISYRHCLVIHKTRPGTVLMPPHDISGKKVGPYLPKGENAEYLLNYMEKSRVILENHPVNLIRRQNRLPSANCCWFWGEGTKPSFDTFYGIYGKKAGMVCAVDLLKGLGLCAGMEVPDVPGATGAKRTDFAAKGQAALNLLNSGCDVVYVHIEAPDESGHAGDIDCKIEAIENIDRHIIGYLYDELLKQGENFRILFTPDHPTPIALRTHTASPVPFLLFDSRKNLSKGSDRYTEAEAKKTGVFIPDGPLLMPMLLEK